MLKSALMTDLSVCGRGFRDGLARLQIKRSVAWCTSHWSELTLSSGA